MDAMELKGHLDQATNEIKTLVQKQDAELKAYGKTTEETGAALVKATSRLDEISGELKSVDARMVEFEKRANRLADGGDSRKSVGQYFTETKGFESGIRVHMDKKDITGASGSAGSLKTPMRRQEIFRAENDRPLFIRNLLNSMPVGSDAIEIMRELAFTNNAAPQYDSGATPTNQLVTKPKSDITYETVTVPVRTMAHYVIASRQILADVPRLQAEIDSRLMYGLNLESDSQILYGTGTGEDLTGLMVATGTNNVGQIAVGTTGDAIARAMIEQIRKGITKNKIANYYNVNGLVVNPQDWETIELAKGSDAHYVWTTVGTGVNAQIWRVPVIESNAMTVGDFLLGDWTMGATLYDREQMNVRVSESHADLFVRNGVAILAEERVALGLERPKAFTKGKFTVASA